MGGDEKAKNQSYVYIQCKDYAWIPATLEHTEGGKGHVTVPVYEDEFSIVCDGGASAKSTRKEVVDLKKYMNKVLPLQNVTAKGDLIEYPDMVEIPFLHEVRNNYDGDVEVYDCVHYCIAWLASQKTLRFWVWIVSFGYCGRSRVVNSFL